MGLVEPERDLGLRQDESEDRGERWCDVCCEQVGIGDDWRPHCVHMQALSIPTGGPHWSTCIPIGYNGYYHPIHNKDVRPKRSPVVL